MVDFGWLPETDSYRTETYSVTPLEGIDRAISTVRSRPEFCGGWIYPPAKHPAAPSVPTEWFALPPTHRIETRKSAGAGQGRTDFAVLILGWLRGMRLMRTGWGHLQRTAGTPGQLVDFVLLPGTATAVLERADEYWRMHRGGRTVRTLVAALHYFLVGQCYPTPVDRFMMQYIAFDALVKVHTPPKNLRHSDRFRFLIDQLGLKTPTWARAARNSPRIVRLRNELFHEAKFDQQPVGFEYRRKSLNACMELRAFNCRAIAATLAGACTYTRSSVHNHSQPGFSVE